MEREATSRDLGFASAMRNSLDGVSSRDFALEYLGACAIMATHLSRLAEEIVDAGGLDDGNAGHRLLEEGADPHPAQGCDMAHRAAGFGDVPRQGRIAAQRLEHLGREHLARGVRAHDVVAEPVVEVGVACSLPVGQPASVAMTSTAGRTEASLKS